ncbi:hypothetical protein [Estrella lausannensis]|uniref:Conserved putative membrane protein n=1 Tax=Estrella lausannensis TaxID=483423 RepID=A0A0H5E6L5_9BACT|nr:hypothetical protein [Estrella lausannensis]CRX38935.1 Conserved putative membrane protein [Estrella lausannensis]
MIKSIIIATALLAALISAPLAFLAGTDPALALSLGALLGIANLFAIKSLLETCLLQEKRDAMRIALTFLIKFPLLYLTGYYLFIVSELPVAYTLAGLSLIFLTALMAATRNALVKT